MMPLHAQKLILFVLQRSSKSCMLLVGGIYVLSLKGFATVILFFLFFNILYLILFSAYMYSFYSRLLVHPCPILWYFIQYDDVVNDNCSYTKKKKKKFLKLIII